MRIQFVTINKCLHVMSLFIIEGQINIDTICTQINTMTLNTMFVQRLEPPGIFCPILHQRKKRVGF